MPQDALELEPPRPQPVPPESPRTRPWLVMASIAGMLATVAVTAIVRPDWVFPAGLGAETPELSEASLRLAMVRERQRIEAFQRREGRLPATLAEAGGHGGGLRYTPREDGTYAIEATLGRAQIVLASNHSVQAFLGNSLQVILSRPVP